MKSLLSQVVRWFRGEPASLTIQVSPKVISGGIAVITVLVLVVAAPAAFARTAPDSVRVPADADVASMGTTGATSPLASAASGTPTPPEMVNYQGQLTNPSGTPEASKTVSMMFCIYDAATGGTLLWSESQSVTTDSQGRFNVMLGTSSTGLANALDGGDRWLEVRVGDEILTPRQRIGSAAYALNGVPSGGIIMSRQHNDSTLTTAGFGEIGFANLSGWKATNTSNAPSARFDHTAVWTGSKMIVWGGHDGSTVVNTGGIYDPATDTWTAVSTTGAPSARYGHTAVYTGTKMIVWGGYDLSNRLNTGGIYDPATDTWTAVSATGAPSARDGHSAVWTGSKMIVWGGSDGSGYMNIGGVYDPATDTWTAVSTTGAPAARASHTAVYTGSKMIVWGGYSSGDMNTGGIYDPATNSWATVSTTGAPSARFDHTAVWTGSKMIVWGGQDSTPSAVNTGGIYDPATDAWTAVGTIGAPSIRYNHTAVWTGSEMIVWGGYDGATSPVKNGGIYDPATDAWTDVGTTGTPSVRHWHTAVWTGSEMIVWGGYGSSAVVNTGGVYSDLTVYLYER